MSLVGPRPLLSTYLEHYNAVQQRRHEVRPGITGWAQVHRRTAVSWDERLSLDVWYVDHWSLGLDAKILLLTVIKVLRAAGVRGGQDDDDLIDLGPPQTEARPSSMETDSCPMR